MHELQQALSAAGSGLLRADRNHLALSDDPLLGRCIGVQRATPSRAELLDLFCRPLLEDLQGLDPAFDRWLADQSERLAQIARTIGETILDEQRDAAGILQAAEQLLRIDRAHEAAWRAVIGAHLGRGDHSAALAAYERCRSALAQCGQLVPSRETEALVGTIRPIPRHAARYSAAANRATMPAPGPMTLAAGCALGSSRCAGLSPDADNELALALVEEITTALAQFRWITCVANIKPANGMATDRQEWLRPPPSDLDFLLDGTIQRNGGRVRIIVRLSDLRAGGTLVWAHRFDRGVSPTSLPCRRISLPKPLRRSIWRCCYGKVSGRVPGGARIQTRWS